MSDKKRKLRNWIIAVVVLGAGAFFGWKMWKDKQSGELPPGIAAGNGRVEAKLADVSAKEPLRVKEVLVNEGDLVQPGQVVVKLDTVTLDAQLAESQARVAAARQQLNVVNATIAKRRSEVRLAEIEVARVGKMLADRASSQREYDVRQMTVATSKSALAEEEAKLTSAEQQVVVAEANVATIQTRITDATLHSPVLGRVLYRLVEPGEVLGAGGKAITIVNLEDVYMEIFLPAAQATAVKIGSEGRITVDGQANRSAVGYVSFVSPEAQFTPKEVETRSERDKLMFRVKIQVPKELVSNYIESIKTGVRGMGYVKVSDSAQWPPFLEANVLKPPPVSAVTQTQTQPQTQTTTTTTATAK